MCRDNGKEVMTINVSFDGKLIRPPSGSSIVVKKSQPIGKCTYDRTDGRMVKAYCDVIAKMGIKYIAYFDYNDIYPIEIIVELYEKK